MAIDPRQLTSPLIHQRGERLQNEEVPSGAVWILTAVQASCFSARLSSNQPLEMPCVIVAALRLMIWLVLHGKWGSLVTHIGVVCSSWTAINQPTSQRDELLPWGAEYRPSVFSANKMVSRPGKAHTHQVVSRSCGFSSFVIHCHSLFLEQASQTPRARVGLLTYLIVAMEGTFLIENPRDSRLLLCPHLREAFRNMHRWGAPASCSNYRFKFKIV